MYYLKIYTGNINREKLDSWLLVLIIKCLIARASRGLAPGFPSGALPWPIYTPVLTPPRTPAGSCNDLLSFHVVPSPQSSVFMIVYVWEGAWNFGCFFGRKLKFFPATMEGRWHICMFQKLFQKYYGCFKIGHLSKLIDSWHSRHFSKLLCSCRYTSNRTVKILWRHCDDMSYFENLFKRAAGIWSSFQIRRIQPRSFKILKSASKLQLSKLRKLVRLQLTIVLLYKFILKPKQEEMLININWAISFLMKSMKESTNCFSCLFFLF